MPIGPLSTPLSSSAFPSAAGFPGVEQPRTAPVPDRYPNLRETDTDDNYETRTRLSVQDADATLILSHGPLRRIQHISRS